MAEVMNSLNISYISEFRLVGFPLVHQAKIVLFVVLLSIYLFTITSNVIIIYLVKFDHHLHKPMYFFLANFSFLEVWYISVTVPKMLSDFLDQDRKISRAGCLTQFYFLFFFGSTENFLLVVISFDRYIAICHPLQYFTIMTEKFCRLLAVGAWTASIIAMICVTIPVSRLTFCGSNEIDHVFCDFSPLVKLSCNGAMLSKFTYFLAGVVMIGCFALIMLSYVHIIMTVIATSSILELQTVLATCSSHFTVVFMYYGTVLFMYMRPSVAITFHADKVVSVFYTILTPLLNPIIYSLRNKQVKQAMQRYFKDLIKNLKIIKCWEHVCSVTHNHI